ncbi:hypothetical protein [Actinomycetospora sp. CA-053990]|uniref:hypothetical protein n=1 Tax=Actinomycetospora sp. CA-053990 TaxID=3239891 RepID=UPI003D936EA5
MTDARSVIGLTKRVAVSVPSGVFLALRIRAQPSRAVVAVPEEPLCRSCRWVWVETD